MPAFLAVVPRAKYTLAFDRFTSSDQSREGSPRHVLMYVAVPPFGRRLYVLEEERWSQID